MTACVPDSLTLFHKKSFIPCAECKPTQNTHSLVCYSKWEPETHYTNTRKMSNSIQIELGWWGAFYNNCKRKIRRRKNWEKSVERIQWLVGWLCSIWPSDDKTTTKTHWLRSFIQRSATFSPQFLVAPEKKIEATRIIFKKPGILRFIARTRTEIERRRRLLRHWCFCLGDEHRAEDRNYNCYYRTL